jgi:sulfate transport system ATP-binding protein
LSVEVERVSRAFDGFRALRDVSLHVPTGRLVALLGPSGSGKTTLLRIIAGLEQPDPGSGAIRFHGTDVSRVRAERRRVGFVFQHYALFRHMTVFENVAFGLRVRPRRERPGRAEIARRVRRLLALVQLDDLERRYPHQLSGGQRQRVALARALAIEPQVLLLDEPFGALDARVRQELRRWLRRLHEDVQVTTLFVTHDQDEALDVADAVVVMNSGRIEQQGSPDHVFHAPATPFVMSFLGQVNRFPATVEGGRLCFASLSLEADPRAGAWPVPRRTAEVYLRPHDLLVSPAVNGRPSFAATIVRVHSAGPSAHLELSGPGDVTLRAELTLDELAGLPARAGAIVHVTPRGLHLFVDGRRAS